MLNPQAKLNPDTLQPDKLESVPTRNGFGEGLVEAGQSDDRVVALCADLAESTRMHWFKEKFPNRYVEMGVAEQNLATVASGMANYGKIPFIASYAAFSPGRNNEQIRTTIALNNVPVKIAGSHAGVSVAQDGATHQALEDIGLMRMQPNMTVLVPCDSEEAKKATIAAAQSKTPVYIRLARAGSPSFTTEETPFAIGKAQIFYEPFDSSSTSSEQAAQGNIDRKVDVGIIACGALVHNAILAAEALREKGIAVSVMNIGTVKPLDQEAIVDFAKSAGAIVTVEEHQIAGGMGSAVAELLAEHYPVPIEFIGVHDQFGQSGTPEELLKHYKLDVDSIKEAVKKVNNKKK